MEPGQSGSLGPVGSLVWFLGTARDIARGRLGEADSAQAWHRIEQMGVCLFDGKTKSKTIILGDPENEIHPNGFLSF